MGASKSKNDFSNQVTLVCHAQHLCNCQHLYLRVLLGGQLLCSRSVLVMPVLPEARSSKSMLICPHLTSASRGIFSCSCRGLLPIERVEQPFVNSALVEFTSQWSLCLVFLQKFCSHSAIYNMQVDYVAMGPVGSHESERTRSQHEFVHAGCRASSLSHASEKLHICICRHTISRLIRMHTYSRSPMLSLMHRRLQQHA